MRITNNVERRLFAEVALGNEWRSERKKYEEQDERSHAVDYKSFINLDQLCRKGRSDLV
jgi:hypothetical protein